MFAGLQQLGLRAAIRFFYTTFLDIFYRLLPFPQLRVIYLRLCGARIGSGTIICRGVRFLNLYRTGYRGLTIGAHCWISEEVMLDLADKIHLGDHVTLGQRTFIMTHLNVGYKTHPLQKYFPPHAKPVTIESGTFVGPYTLILAGITIGSNNFIMARSLINQNVTSNMYYNEIAKHRTIPVTFFTPKEDIDTQGSSH